jgi:hypothetical protein
MMIQTCHKSFKVHEIHSESQLYSSYRPQRVNAAKNCTALSRKKSYRIHAQPPEQDSPPTSSTDDRLSNETSVGLKATWYGAELLGNIIGMSKTNKQNKSRTPTSISTTMNRQQVIQSIKADYNENYFISGKGSLSAYDPNCIFADPFASFSGVNRFKNNVSNLGSLLKDIKLDITEFTETENNEIITKWKFSSILMLPWRPRLAAAGGTTHVLSPDTGLVIKHIESWDIEPGRVVKSLLKPSSKVPTGKWDVLMNSVHDGDLTGIWLAVCGDVLKIAGVGGGSGLVMRLILASSGGGDSEEIGRYIWGFEGPCWVLFVVCLVSEVLKIAKGMQGGETGT